MKIKKLFLTLFTIVLLFTLTGCFSKEKISIKDFVNTSKKDKLTVYSITDNYKSYENLKNGYAAANLLGWRVTFFEFKNSDSAEDIFDQEVENIKKNKTKKDEEEKSGLRNYETYELTTSTNYYYISRVDNTLLSVRSSINNKNDIKKFINKLRY